MGDRANILTHVLKTWPDAFRALWSGDKRFEYRLNDRGFAVGHDLELLEYDPHNNEFSGRSILARVTWIAEGKFGIPAGYCVMSIYPYEHRDGGGVAWSRSREATQ